MEKDGGQLRPYRATQLWNDVIRRFRTGMVRGRHRRYMKSYDACFSAAEAVDWLRGELQKNPNFGPSVTRAQTLQLLEKFQKARVFEDVRGTKYKDPISDNGRLYRFTHTSPVKGSRTPSRTPLVARSTLENMEQVSALPREKLDFDQIQSEGSLSECHLVATSRVSVQEVEEIWKGMTLASLQKTLQLHSLEDILDSDFVSTQNIIHNMTQINKNGVVNNIERKDQLPYWVLSAMRCLARWPDKVEDNLPDYPGFEQDVFKVIKDYFQSLAEPLLTFTMYEVFTNVFVCADSIGKPKLSKSHVKTQSTTTPGGITSFASVENLMMNLTMNGVPGEEDPNELPFVSDLNHAYHPARSCDPRVNGVGIRSSSTAHRNYGTHYASEQNLGRCDRHEHKPSLGCYASMASMPQHADRMETSFRVDGNEPRTHVYYKQGTTNGMEPLYYSLRDVRAQPQNSGFAMMNSQRFPSAVSIDSPYGKDEVFLSYEQKCLSTNDVSRMQPYPENGLLQHNRVNSWRSMQQGYPSTHVDDCTYGYTVVVSTTPKRERQRAHSGGNYGRCSGRLDYIHTEHDYYRQSVADFRDLQPPPYIAPPSYTSLYPSSMSNSGDNASSSSYETAPSHHSAQQEDSSPAPLTSEELNLPNDNQQDRGKHHPTMYSRKNLAESYRRAVDSNSSCSTPLGRSLYSNLQRSESSPTLLSPVSRNRVMEALQVCCLLLPAASRRKLHLLLRLMVKLIENTDLKVDDDTPTRPLVLRTFARCILRSAEEADYNEILSLRLVTFMMDNYAEIMKVPEDLKLQIEERIVHLRRQKVSTEEFERQKLSHSQRALNDLLNNIVKDKAMAQKEKKRRLKQFQKSYPDIYTKHFPNSQSEADLFPGKPRIKPALLSRPLKKLKSFRI